MVYVEQGIISEGGFVMNCFWYQNSYRRNLVDMHIEDWDEAFLSQFDVEDYVRNLQQAKLQTPMLYLQAHTGHCYWPTKSGHMHNAFKGREDMMRRLADRCHALGMTVVGYYSLIFNTYEEDRHPEWALRNKDGLSARDRKQRKGLCCPNNPGYRAFTEEQIREISEYFTLDGMFYDMLFWPGFCYCSHCRDRWQRETGLTEMPTEENWYDETWQLWVRKHQEWMGEFAMWARNTTHKYLPGIPIEQNYASGVAGDWHNAATELVNEACDYTGGDLYGDLYNHSFTAKYYRGITKHQPFEYMTCRCDSDLTQHTVTKSEERLTTEVLLTAAHHGATLVIDAIDPVGTLDSRLYDRLGRVFEKQIPYEPYFKGDLVSDVGVYYCTRGRYDRDNSGFTAKECAVGAVRAMIQKHVAVNVLSEGYPGDFSEFPFVMVPGAAGMTEKERQRLIDYVKNGGTLYFSGAGDEILLRELTGGIFRGMTKETRTYLAPAKAYESLFGWFNAKYPMPYSYKLPLVTFPDAVKTAAYITLPYTDPQEQRYASIHSNPPGIPTEHPALVFADCGKGRVIWCAANPETDDRPAYKALLMALTETALTGKGFTVSSTAPKQVELVTFRTEDGFLLSAADLLCDEEMLPVPGFTVSLRCDNPKALHRLPDKTALPFIWEKGVLTFTVPTLTQFDMFEVIL